MIDFDTVINAISEIRRDVRRASQALRNLEKFVERSDPSGDLRHIALDKQELLDLIAKASAPLKERE